MNKKGVAYILQWQEEELPEFLQEMPIEQEEIEVLKRTKSPKLVEWTTLFISGGRKDKISKGDIAGLFFKQGGAEKDQVGIIEIQQNGSYVGVYSSAAQSLIEKTNNTR